MEGTVFVPALEGMKHVKSEGGEMLSKEFLEVCKLIMPVIGIFTFKDVPQFPKNLENCSFYIVFSSYFINMLVSCWNPSKLNKFTLFFLLTSQS